MNRSQISNSSTIKKNINKRKTGWCAMCAIDLQTIFFYSFSNIECKFTHVISIDAKIVKWYLKKKNQICRTYNTITFIRTKRQLGKSCKNINQWFFLFFKCYKWFDFFHHLWHSCHGYLGVLFLLSSCTPRSIVFSKMLNAQSINIFGLMHAFVSSSSYSIVSLLIFFASSFSHIFLILTQSHYLYKSSP